MILTPEHLKAALDYYRVVFSGRTRYEGQEPRHDEVIVTALAAANARIAELEAIVELYEHAATAVIKNRPGCRCDTEDCNPGLCSQCLLMEATAYMDDAAKPAAERGEG